MTISRRHFLETASLTVIAGAVMPGALAQRPPSLNDDRFNLDQLSILKGVSALTFKPLIGETFDAVQEGEFKDRLTLLEVNDPATAPEAGKEAQKVDNMRLVGRIPKPWQQAVMSFSLRFQGTGVALQQETYTMEHASLGSFPLFLVPAGPGVDTHTYTATFSLMVPSAKR